MTWRPRASAVVACLLVGSASLLTASCGLIEGHRIARYFDKVAELEAFVTALDRELEEMTRDPASGASKASSLEELQRKKERLGELSAKLAALQAPPACEQIHQLEESYFQQVEESLSLFMTEVLPNAGNLYRRHFAMQKMQARLKEHAALAQKIQKEQERIAGQYGIALEQS